MSARSKHTPSVEITSPSRRIFLQTSARAGVGALAVASLKSAPVYAQPIGRHLAPRIPAVNTTQLRISPQELPASPHFRLGIASGDPSFEDIILWTYYEGFFRLIVVVWLSKPDGSLEQISSALVSRKDGGFVHVNLGELQADQRYQYAFVELDFENKAVAQSAVGTFKTAIHPDSRQPVTFGAVSCTNQSYEPAVLEHAAQRRDLDAFLLLGDTSYNDNVNTLQGFRDRWALNLSKTPYLKLRASTSVIATIDDHEIIDDFDPETIEPERLKAALQAFFDHLPIKRNQEHPRRIWRKFSFGKSVDVFTLDSRTERKPSTGSNERPEYISYEQMDWLKTGLQNSQAAFKLIMNSVPISDFGRVLAADRWQGYPKQRTEILSFIENQHIPGVLWLAGDFHFPSAGRISAKGLGSKAIEILAGPGAQKPNIMGAGLWLSHQFDYSSLSNNYLTLRFDPATMEVEATFNIAGASPQHTDPAAVSVGFTKKYYLA